MEAQIRDYKGHRIELTLDHRSGDAGFSAGGQEKPELRVDGEPLPYEQLPDGQFALRDYAYDWTDDLMELAQRWIDHRARADRARRGGAER